MISEIYIWVIQCEGKGVNGNIDKTRLLDNEYIGLYFAYTYEEYFLHKIKKKFFHLKKRRNRDCHQIGILNVLEVTTMPTLLILFM